MKITRIDKIKDHLIFKNFNWTTSLPNFNRFNLIYGWNGSGKTTLSNLLRCIEKRKDVSIGDLSIIIDDRVISSTQFATETLLPQIRVFNREFIDENIFNPTGPVSPIFFLGKDSIDKQKESEKLKLKLSDKQGIYTKLIKQRNQAEHAADQFAIDKAKLIKELLSSSGSNNYNNYNKTTYKNKANELSKSPDFQSKILSNDEKYLYKTQKGAISKAELPALSLALPDLHELLIRVNSILTQTIEADILEFLKNDVVVSTWVKDGLALHDKAESKECLFCRQTLPEDLLNRYKRHFNDQFNKFISKIELLISDIEMHEQHVANFTFYNKAEFYDHLSAGYIRAEKDAKASIGLVKQYLITLKINLLSKKQNPFQISDSISEKPPELSTILSSVNTIIAEHNTETQNFNSTIAQARLKLEESLVAESIATFKQNNDKITSFTSSISSIITDIGKLKTEIEACENRIVEHRRPADELNRDLASYLGHADIRFEVLENGYQIMRYGKVATGLSEGEKTAIAFLHFLKSLSDKDFNIKEGIIVIDDPISSLDANSLFCAFGFMQERVKDVGQLFIFTHNFPFFRQVKNWYHYLPRNKTSYYMIVASYGQNDRNSNLLPLDPLLSQYDSEYHYLFKLIYECANRIDGQPLESYYHLPNIARRLLESFLSFKYPKKSGKGLAQLLKEINFDEAKKSRISRFLNTHSHNGDIDDSEHDMSILSETRQILGDVIKLIEVTDKNHHDELVELVKPPDIEDTD